MNASSAHCDIALYIVMLDIYLSGIRLALCVCEAIPQSQLADKSCLGKEKLTAYVFQT